MTIDEDGPTIPESTVVSPKVDETSKGMPCDIRVC